MEERMENKKLGEIKTAFFTGHRRIDRETSEKIAYVLDCLVRNMMNFGVTKFYTGGALGFDTIAALAVLRLKEKNPSVKLELILPCKSQTRSWSAEDIQVYNYILSKADCVEYVSNSYTSTCMHERNNRLVELGDMGVAFLEYSGGGTAYTVNHALKQGKEIINIYELVSSM